MLLNCIKKLGKQINSIERGDLEESFTQHKSKGLSEYDASMAALSDYHKNLFDATNEMRSSAGLRSVEYKPYVAKSLEPEAQSTASTLNLEAGLVEPKKPLVSELATADRAFPVESEVKVDAPLSREERTSDVSATKQEGTPKTRTRAEAQQDRATTAASEILDNTSVERSLNWREQAAQDRAQARLERYGPDVAERARIKEANAREIEADREYRRNKYRQLVAELKRTQNWRLREDVVSQAKVTDIGREQVIKDLVDAGIPKEDAEGAAPEVVSPVGDVPANLGPGAASIHERAPEVKERKFGTRFTKDERIAQEIRDSIGTAKYYEPIPNKVTAENATKLIDERGVAESIKIVRDEDNSLPHHVRSAMGQITIQRLNKTYRNLKEANPKEAEFVLEQATDLAEWQMDYGTRLGQGVQSFAMWARLTPEGKLLTYKRGVEKAQKRLTKESSGEVEEIVSALNKTMTDAERLDALKKLFKTNQTARKVKPDFEKIIQAAKDGKLTDELFYEIAGERLGLPVYNKEIANEITRRALEIEDAPEGMPRDKKILELNKYLAEQKGFDVADLPIGIYYGNILSGYNTHAVNTLDTFLNVVSEINGLVVQNPAAAAKIYGGLLRGFTDGKLDALLTLTEGRMVTDGKWLESPRLMELAKFGQKGGVPIKPVNRRSRVVKSLAESKPATVLNAYKYVTRLLAASDAIMFRGAKEARASLLAFRMAKEAGLEGDALNGRVREILALDRMSDFRAQAEREGFTGAEAKVRAAELRDMIRDKDLSSDAADFAGEATYNHEPHGALGYASDVVGKWSQKYKALKLFVPFTRIVANVTNRGLNYTPYGFKRAFFGYSHGELQTPEARRLILTHAILGTTGLVTLGSMQAAGMLQIHGAGPSDREKRKQLQTTGWRPYTIQINDVYMSYIYTPVGLGLSVVGNMTDSQRYNELEQKDAATRAAYSVARLGSTIFSQSFLSGLSRLFNALSESPTESITAVKQVLSGTVASMTTPNLARDVYKLFDNKAYQSNGLMEDLIRNTPFAGIALKPQLNAFAEPVTVQRQRFLDVKTSDPVWRFVIDKGLRIPVPSKTTEVTKGRRITPQEYYDLMLKTGPRLKAWVRDNQGKLEAMTEDVAQEELSKASGVITKDELDEMRGREEYMKRKRNARQERHTPDVVKPPKSPYGRIPKRVVSPTPSPTPGRYNVQAQ